MLPAAPVMVMVTGFFMANSRAKVRNGSRNRAAASLTDGQLCDCSLADGDDVVRMGAAKAALFDLRCAGAAGAPRRGNIREPCRRIALARRCHGRAWRICL